MHRRTVRIAFVLACCVAAACPAAPQDEARSGGGVRLVDAFPGVAFERPVYVAQAPGDSDRFFVVEQAGRIVAVDPEGTTSTFLDIRDQVSRRHNEEGLLGLAFHPDFATNGRFFVHYSHAFQRSRDRRGVVSEFGLRAKDRAQADARSERVLLEVPQPYGNHNGGMLAFGPDEMLYASFGDGGAANDPHGHGQDLETLLGSMLRLDVDAKPGRRGYGIPDDNPFVRRRGARPEIWAYGLRNVWRFSFDRETGEMWGGDVGQNQWEEVGILRRGGNHGWRLREGLQPFGSADAPTTPLVEPLAVYPRADGVSVTGGYVYRGQALPHLRGAYLYADYGSGTVWALRRRAGLEGPPAGPDDVDVEVLLRRAGPIASFGEDHAGELYACLLSGSIRRFEPADGPPAPPPFPELLSATGLFRDLAALTPVEGALPYGVRSPLWSDGATKERFVVLPEGTSLSWSDDGAFGMPEGASAVKSFAIADTRGRWRTLETRVIRRTAGGFDAASYRWLDDGSDARLVTRREETVVEGRRGPQAWTVPGPADCGACHTDAAGFLLGLSARQTRHVEAAEGSPDLLLSWAESGALRGLPAEGFSDRPRLVGLGDDATAADRARSYLDANCSFCHRPGAPLVTHLDLRAATPLAETGLLDVRPSHGDLGIADGRLLAARRPAESLLLHRMAQRGPGRMPPLASAVPDKAALEVLTNWVRSLRKR